MNKQLTGSIDTNLGEMFVPFVTSQQADFQIH